MAERSPDVVLMDIRMPRLDGLAATDELVRSGSPSKVIVLTTFDADDDVMRALRHGADGFLLKDTPPDRIVEAVRLVAAGQSILSPASPPRCSSRCAPPPAAARTSPATMPAPG